MTKCGQGFAPCMTISYCPSYLMLLNVISHKGWVVRVFNVSTYSTTAFSLLSMPITTG